MFTSTLIPTWYILHPNIIVMKYCHARLTNG
jgi:hypothetical protein